MDARKKGADGVGGSPFGPVQLLAPLAQHEGLLLVGLLLIDARRRRWNPARGTASVTWADTSTVAAFRNADVHAIASAASAGQSAMSPARSGRAIFASPSWVATAFSVPGGQDAKLKEQPESMRNDK